MNITGLFLALTLTWIVACSGQEQADEELQAGENDQGANQQEMANEDAGDSGNSEDFTEDENMNQQGIADQGADLNSDTSNDTEVGQDVGANNPLADNSSANPFANNTGGAPIAAEEIPPSVNPAPLNEAVATPSAPPPMAPGTQASDTAPIPGGRVLYVPEGGVQVVSEPNGSPIVTLNQGDHPLTWEESGWLKLANGMYVPVGSLSEKGVPRPFSGATFQ